MSTELLVPSVNDAIETALSSGKGMGKVLMPVRLGVLSRPWSYWCCPS